LANAVAADATVAIGVTEAAGAAAASAAVRALALCAGPERAGRGPEIPVFRCMAGMIPRGRTEGKQKMRLRYV